MDRRIAIGSLSIASILPKLAWAASNTLSFVSFSPAPAPTNPKSDVYGYPKGTISFKFVRSASPKTILTGSLISYGNNGGGSGGYQCVELIRRYAQQLKFPTFSGAASLPSLGNGNQCASLFAGASAGGFSYLANGASTLPSIGSVISMTTWYAQESNGRGGYTPVLVEVNRKLVPELVTGHVGIVQSITQTSSTAQATLFDENMPVPNQWRTVSFTKSGSGWIGKMYNTGLYIDVVGWANPTGAPLK